MIQACKPIEAAQATGKKMVTTHETALCRQLLALFRPNRVYHRY